MLLGEQRRGHEHRDLGALKEMFDQIVTPARSLEKQDEDWYATERARLSFPIKHDPRI